VCKVKQNFSVVIDDIILIMHQNAGIRQVLTSAFADNDLELTFRKVCTADQTGEVEFLDVNH